MSSWDRFPRNSMAPAWPHPAEGTSHAPSKQKSLGISPCPTPPAATTCPQGHSALGIQCSCAAPDAGRAHPSPPKPSLSCGTTRARLTESDFLSRENCPAPPQDEPAILAEAEAAQFRCSHPERGQNRLLCGGEAERGRRGSDHAMPLSCRGQPWVLSLFALFSLLASV